MAIELWEDIRDAIIEILKIENTIAGSQVRTGKIIPIDNPFSPVVAPEDSMPLIIVSLRLVRFDSMNETGKNDQYDRRPEYQIDGYIKHDQAAADAAELPIDEWVNNQLDLLGAQVSQAIGKYRRFRGESDPNPLLRLRDKAHMWPVDFSKNDMIGDQGEIIGAISMRVEAVYQENRVLQPVDDLESIDNSITTGLVDSPGSVTKNVAAADQ